ncbi:VIT1/CCC1 transporter family protein [Inquilinus sp. OTU3971]|uniref:VIT1/CCC1 transporter family protein n=1 Tax=Inquilinus sp. OTU3971 TaxID=3043855 RepID=UPI00313DAB42
MPPLEHGHSADEIRRRLAAGPRSSYVRDWIYGGIDGAVTTFAVVAGVAGADLPMQIVLILGAANLIADGFSMAAGNFSGTKAERDDYDRLAAVERKHVALDPDGEREEIRQIFAAKGFSGAGLERVVATITSNEPGWIRTMLAEEYGLASTRRSPWAAAATTFLAFLACGLVPLLPYVLGGGLAASTVGTALAFFGIGSAKSCWSTTTWWRSGIETLLIGMGAAAIAFLVGFGLKSGLGVAD